MKRIGTVPKIFRKYNLCRYGSSQEAEYKLPSLEPYYMMELTNNTPRTQTSPGAHPVYFISNQGIIGRLNGEIETLYDEDFILFLPSAYRDKIVAGSNLLVSGGFSFLITSFFSSSSYAGGKGCRITCTALASGFSSVSGIIEHYFGVGAPLRWTTRSIHAHLSGNTSSSTKWDFGVWTENGPTGIARSYMIDDPIVIGWESAPPTLGNIVAYDAGEKKIVQQNVLQWSGATGSPLPSNPSYQGCLRLRDKNFISPANIEVSIIAASGYTPALTDGLMGIGNENLVTGEIYHFNGLLVSMERKNSTHVPINDKVKSYLLALLSDGFYTHAEPSRGDVKGRYFIVEALFDTVFSREIKPFLVYYDPEKESFTHSDYLHLPRGPLGGYSLRNLTAPSNFADSFIYVPIWIGEHAGQYSLFFKGKLLIPHTDKRFLCFGTFYLNLETKVLTNAESDEQFDLSSILPEPPDHPGYGGLTGSGLYSTILRLRYTESQYSSHGWFITKNKLFFVEKMQYSSQNPGIYGARHCEKWYIYQDQVVYELSENGYKAFDLQTFMRLDHLPGFNSCVQEFDIAPLKI